MKTGEPGLMVAVLLGLIVQADAHADCPELEQLQSAYLAVSRDFPLFVKRLPSGEMPSPPSRELCEASRRLSEATRAWVEYARQHDELCRFSGSLPMMEREYLNAVEERDDVCSGHPARPGRSIFPAERGIRP